MSKNVHFDEKNLNLDDDDDDSFDDFKNDAEYEKYHLQRDPKS